MCGICGYTRHGGENDQDLIRRMMDAQNHRGPDDSGVYADHGVVLGHSRLSIIDLEGGKQPMSDEDQRCHVVFNGEIYNFKEIGKTLSDMGIALRTRSDTEVLLHLYRLYGTGMVDYLEGMFAFALWDKETETLFIARDRFGKKPLYYTQQKGQLIFASELKALICHPHVKRRLSFVAMQQYLAFEYVPAPYSIYKDVFKLDAGSCLVWHRGTCTLNPYWDFPLRQAHDLKSPEEWAERLDKALESSVRRRLISDVPLGVLLSGGIDSSIVLAMVCRHLEPSKVQTFSIGFREKSYDESVYARKAAGWFGTDHHEEILDGKMALDILPDVVEQFDEPFADASALPTFLLSRFVRRHVTVALGGDGGDELFAGYDTFLAASIAQRFKWIPRNVVQKALLPMAHLLPASEKNMSLGFRLTRFLRDLHQEPVMRNQLWLSAFSPDVQRELVPEPFGDPGFSLSGMESMQCETEHSHWLDALQYAYVKTYLKEDILTKVDRASMAHSLEIRSPFLDRQVVTLAASMPPGLKLKGFQRKYILKRAFRGVLPEDILHRSKKGFGIPKAKWLKEDLNHLLNTLFSEERMRSVGYFSIPYVQRLIREHAGHVRDHQKELWTLLMFELWREANQAEIC